mmetsp:Transcript_17601/g.34313  ORF Transcript_17601/g.34313 Transcript_17601/m.34313 type:complete len:367 (+) Transcript_17601:84-1184(+)
MDNFRSPTFFVKSDKQRGILDEFHRKERQLCEAYHKNRPLCFHARSHQRTHPGKARLGHRDADATVQSPLLLGVADGVSQVEEYGIDAARLPRELLRNCQDLGMVQLLPSSRVSHTSYKGPIPLLKRAFERTQAYGSTTVVLAVMDNSTRIHGKLHPMIAVITVGDCELLILRRCRGRQSQLQAVFHTEMQRIDGHVQTPLQLARVDSRIDPDFDEELTIEVIEKGSAVHCISAYEGDVVVMGSDGVFDNLFLDEVADLCNTALPPGRNWAASAKELDHLARSIVEASHRKSQRGPSGQYMDAPIGPGGKMDDTAVVVGEVVQWTEEHERQCKAQPAPISWLLTGLLPTCGPCCERSEDEAWDLED